MDKPGLIVLAVCFGGIYGCDGTAPPNQSTEPEAAIDQLAAPDAGAIVEAPFLPEPYDRLELLQDAVQAEDELVGVELQTAQVERAEPATMDELIELLEAVPSRYPVPNDYFEQFEQGLPLRENWMNCTRYRTNNATAGFCEDQPPASWRPFNFNDQRYFLVPLGPSA